MLYLNVGEPQAEAWGLETPDGHAIHYDESGAVIGITLLNVRWTLEHEGTVTFTLPAEHVALRRRTPADARRRLTRATPSMTYAPPRRSSCPRRGEFRAAEAAPTRHPRPTPRQAGRTEIDPDEGPPPTPK